METLVRLIASHSKNVCALYSRGNTIIELKVNIKELYAIKTIILVESKPSFKRYINTLRGADAFGFVSQLKDNESS